MQLKYIAAGAAMLLLAGTAHAGEKLVVYNQSGTEIHHLYMSSTDTKSWGPDQLGDDADDVIAPGSKFTLTGIDADNYDIKLISDDGDVCEVDDVDFSTSYQWVITDSMLANCD